jgi:hypothetical protein
MERLTSDNVKEMGMYKLAHNHVFGKDGEVWYRDFDREISIRNLIREIAVKHDIDSELAGYDDDEFDEAMLDNLQYGTEELSGVLALLNMTLWGMCDIRDDLMEYEDTGIKPSEIEELKKSEDYWHREAIKATAQLGEIKIKINAMSQSMDASNKDKDTGYCFEVGV